MLRINLLPPYIYEGAKRTKVTILWVVILLAVIGGMVFGKVSIDKQTQEFNDRAAATEPAAKEADDKAALAQTIQARSAEIVKRATFVRDSQKYTDTYPTVFRSIVRYTWSRVLYDQVVPQGQAVQIQAFAPTLADVGHYMMAMENNQDVAKVEVAMNSIPTFPAGAGGQQGGQQGQNAALRPPSGGHDFTATLTLVNPIAPGPTYGSVGGGTQGGGFGGGGGRLGGGMGMGPSMGPGSAMMGSGGGGMMSPAPGAGMMSGGGGNAGGKTGSE